ncbi:MAG: hypothetical protein AAF907_12770, partial [Planctomycetota bacterium]
MIAPSRLAVPAVLLFGSLSFAPGCDGPGAAAEIPPVEDASEAVVEMLGGEEGYELIAKPTKVQAYRVKRIPPTPIPPGGDPPKPETKPPWLA